MDTAIEKAKERVLLEQIREGDFVAFKAIYDLYAAKLMAKLFHLVKSEEVAQDLLQDIFLKIWENRAHIDVERSFGAYLFKVATNHSLNSFRNSMREQKRILDYKYDEEYSHIEEEIAYHDAVEALNNALKSLTKRQREVYVLHKIEGKSYKEISEMLQISHSAINQHIQAASNHIKQFLSSRIGIIMVFLAMDFLKK